MGGRQIRGARPGTGLASPAVSCGTNQAQLWLNQPVPVASGILYSGTSVLQQFSGDTLWTVP
jgi:hypothetical protein